MGYLELIVGPMFSGKTTRLIERYNEISKTEKCLVINSHLDTRYGQKKLVSHDGLSIDCVNIEIFDELSNSEHQKRFVDATYIFINEAQFFSNLKLWTMHVLDIMRKNVILCGLDLDYKKEQFGELLDLKCRANKFIQLTGKCNNCSNPSMYTHRISEEEQQLVIGVTNYIPVCEECYNKYENVKKLLNN
tara:strand:- start:5511 stop:6080 length:570 start_codon:yes stop_codon:yes gene_type:complete